MKPPRQLITRSECFSDRSSLLKLIFSLIYNSAEVGYEPKLGTLGGIIVVSVSAVLKNLV